MLSSDLLHIISHPLFISVVSKGLRACFRSQGILLICTRNVTCCTSIAHRILCFSGFKGTKSFFSHRSPTSFFISVDLNGLRTRAPAWLQWMMVAVSGCHPNELLMETMSISEVPVWYLSRAGDININDIKCPHIVCCSCPHVQQCSYSPIVVMRISLGKRTCLNNAIDLLLSDCGKDWKKSDCEHAGCGDSRIWFKRNINGRNNYIFKLSITRMVVHSRRHEHPHIVRNPRAQQRNRCSDEDKL